MSQSGTSSVPNLRLPVDTDEAYGQREGQVNCVAGPNLDPTPPQRQLTPQGRYLGQTYQQIQNTEGLNQYEQGKEGLALVHYTQIQL